MTKDRAVQTTTSKDHNKERTQLKQIDIKAKLQLINFWVN